MAHNVNVTTSRAEQSPLTACFYYLFKHSTGNLIRDELIVMNDMFDKFI